MLAATLIALTLQSAPVTYREVTALRPVVAGERLLSGEAHGPIVAIEPERILGPIPAGTARLFLYERAERVPGGCVRRRWTVDFATRDAARADEATVARRYPVDEVGLSDGGSCDRAIFVGSNGPDRAQVLAMLSALARWRSRPGAVKLSCSQEAAYAAICGSPAQARAALMRAAPWHAPAPLQLWLKIDGRPGYTVTFDALPATTIALSYRVPAPF